MSNVQRCVKMIDATDNLTKPALHQLLFEEDAVFDEMSQCAALGDSHDHEDFIVSLNDVLKDPKLLCELFSQDYENSAHMNVDDVEMWA